MPETFRESVRVTNYSDVALITASTNDVRAFMETYADHAESPFVFYLCRAGIDCAARAVELTRRLADGGPNNAERQSELGEALLFPQRQPDRLGDHRARAPFPVTGHSEATSEPPAARLPLMV